MTLIRVETTSVMSLEKLWRAVLKFIYDQDNMPLKEINEMQAAIVTWSKKINLDIEMDRVNEAERDRLGFFALMLKKNENGELESQKFSVKYHGINYKKLWRLPEAYTPEDFERGRIIEEREAKKYL